MPHFPPITIGIKKQSKISLYSPHNLFIQFSTLPNVSNYLSVYFFFLDPSILLQSEQVSHYTGLLHSCDPRNFFNFPLHWISYFYIPCLLSCFTPSFWQHTFSSILMRKGTKEAIFLVVCQHIDYLAGWRLLGRN